MRDTAVTYSKGIAIVLVVIGHAFSGTNIQYWVNMFHVPVFFFMSGYCFKDAYLCDAKTFVYKKIKGIYWPFLKWSLLFLLLHNILFRIGIYNSIYGYGGNGSSMYSHMDFMKVAKSIVFWMDNPELLLGPFWFLRSFFVGTFVFYFALFIITKALKKYSVIITGVILLSLSLIANYFSISIYLLNYREFMTAFFIWAGYAYRRSNAGIHKDVRLWCLALVLITLGCIFWRGEASTVTFEREIPFMISAFSGIILTFGLSTKLAEANNQSQLGFLEIIGNHTMTIFTWHLSSFLIVTLLLIKIYDLPHYRLAEYPVLQLYASAGWGLLYSAIGVLIPMAITSCNKRIKSSWLFL